MKLLPNLHEAVRYGWEYVLNSGILYQAKNWQGTKAPADMWEALWLSWRAPMPQTVVWAEKLIQPNLPWANVHFEERVGEIPHNPPPSHEIWPYNQESNRMFIKDEKFDHTYPERFWPKYDKTKGFKTRMGIRFKYGDLNDVIGKLNVDIDTRQAYIPIWFPEDTGKPEGLRVPCTLGYHVIVRNGFLHITYFMRSLDMLRHYQDDIYLCYRLAHHIKEKLNKKGHNLELGFMAFEAVNSHIFTVDKDALKYKLKTWKTKE